MALVVYSFLLLGALVDFKHSHSVCIRKVVMGLTVKLCIILICGWHRQCHTFHWFCPMAVQLRQTAKSFAWKVKCTLAWLSIVCCLSSHVFACCTSQFAKVAQPFPTSIPKSFCCISQQCCMFCSAPFLKSKIFDMTLGYPGEGPWSVLTANIDSVHSHPHVYEWSHSLLCLQETRLSLNNFEIPKQKFQNKGLEMHPGKLLKLRTDKNGTHRVPHGGVACVSYEHVCKPFSEDQDATGQWKHLFESTRVCAVWIQIQPKVRALCFSFYGQTHHENGSFFDFNNDFLEKLLLICSQFGDIPILIAGDFQLEPNMYPSVANAILEGHWTDPLVQTDSSGRSCRPLTFSRNGNFKNPQDNCSSIDGILVNRVALTALSSIEVCGNDGRQHAPIIATFDWPKIFQVGCRLEKPAAIQLSSLPKVNGCVDHQLIDSTAKQLWEEKFCTPCLQTSDDLAWESINDWALTTFKEVGCSFGPGLKTRGRFPKIKKCKIFLGQEKDGSASTNFSSRLSKLHKMVVELRCRINRTATKTADMHITWKLQNKVATTLNELKVCSWWTIQTNLNDDSLHWVLKQLQDKIVFQRAKEKQERIRRWKEKMILGTTSKNVSSEVYQWIRQKNQNTSANLMQDKDGNILYSPDEAIRTINEQWDDIFAKNILHEDPMKILHFVWPYVQQCRHDAHIPTLTGTMLHRQILSRKKHAASGLDGWRTLELQNFPITIFNQIALFFRQIESGERCMPKILGVAKQVILDKNGEDTPLQKRLLSILPALVLSYTSVRFRQLQKWQQLVMPSQLHGGISGRRMSEIPASLQIQVDHAKCKNDHFVGLKLDKSKCFDRLIPSVTAALFAALGIPSFLNNFFLQLYSNLKRFMTYKSWIAENYTTCANGLVQGCSMSLLAINAHMCIWALFVDRIVHIQAKIFIDDSYIWASLEKINFLQDAIRMTEQWDDLVGQSLNTEKCEVFATSKIARKRAMNLFPQMKHSNWVEVLGVRIRLTNESNFHWPTSKTSKISRDIALIKAIPCSRDIHEHIVAAKVLPQLSFAPMINDIPLNVLRKLQDQISDCLWKRRPMWRCKWLLLGVLCKPHRVDPILSRAYCTILETISFVKSASQEQREMWQNLTLIENGSKTSLLQHFLQACSLIHIDFHPPFHLSAFKAVPICFLDFARRDLKKVLQYAIRHVCYQKATKIARKDIKACVGYLDFDLSVAGTACLKNQWLNYISMYSFWESAMVGCAITNDRCCAAGFTSTNECRFCNGEKETFSHLVRHCPSLEGIERPTFDPEIFGPNFATLGLVEVLQEQVSHKLSISSTALIPVSNWNPHEMTWIHMWTDGSCSFQESFWDTQGGYAVISQKGETISCGCVQHWVLSSYSCELWAGIVAWAHASSPLVIHSDCEAFVNQTNQMVASKRIQDDWPHQEWWNFFLTLVLLRCSNPVNVLKCEWCPSHVLESVPIELISPKLAAANKTTIENIRHNRQADKIAKRAVQMYGKSFRNFNDDHKKISDWHLWIAQVNAKVSMLSKQDTSKSPHEQRQVEVEGIPQNTIPIEELTQWHSIEAFEKHLPRWTWHPDVTNYTWSSECDPMQPKGRYISITDENWKIGLQYLIGLKWMPNGEGKTSYIELAYDAWFKGVRFETTKNCPSTYATLLRKVCNQACKSFETRLFPGTQKSGYVSKGKTLPAGFITANALISSDALKSLAVDVLRGRGQRLIEWEQPFH